MPCVTPEDTLEWSNRHLVSNLSTCSSTHTCSISNNPMKVVHQRQVEVSSSKLEIRRLRISLSSSNNNSRHLNIQVYQFRTHQMLTIQEACRCRIEDLEVHTWRTRKWLVSKYLSLVETHTNICMECDLHLQCEDLTERRTILTRHPITLSTWWVKMITEVAVEEAEAPVEEDEEADAKEVVVVEHADTGKIIHESTERSLMEDATVVGTTHHRRQQL